MADDIIPVQVDFPGPENPRWSEVRFVRIFYREKWADEWTLLPGARLDMAIWALAPTMPRAQISMRYGATCPDGNTTGYEEVPPLNLMRHYIKIQFELSIVAQVNPELFLYPVQFPASWEWNGIVEVQSDVQDAPVLIDNVHKVPYGTMTYMAYGFEAMLDRHRIHRSLFKKPGDGMEILESAVGLTFNEGGRGNRSKKKVTTVPWEGDAPNPNNGDSTLVRDHYVFEYHANEADARENTWSTRDIVEYLIRSEVGYPTPDEPTDLTAQGLKEWKENRLQIFVDAPTSLVYLPKWDAPEIETHMVSMWDLLNTLISRRRLNWWHLERARWRPQKLELKIGSMTDKVLTLPSPDDESEDATISRNLKLVDFSFDEHWSADCIHQKDTTHSVDQVICYGARRTNTFTADFGMSTADHFHRGWTLSEQAIYEKGGSDWPNYPPEPEIAERQVWHAFARSREEVSHVFKRFQLNHLLQWPKNFEDDEYWEYFGNVRLLPSIPLKEATDYSGYQPGGSTVDIKKDRVYLDRRPPLVLIEIPGKPGKYADLAKLGRGGNVEAVVEDDVRDWAAIIRVPKDGHSITIDTTRAPQHTIAYGDFKLRPEDELVHGYWDWKTIKATVTVTDDRFCEVKWPEDDADELKDKDIKRTMRIPCGAQYRLDYVGQDTIVDVDPEGNPIRVAALATLQDDTNKLKNIATSAYNWYSKERAAIRIRLPWQTEIMEPLRLGHYVKHLYHSTRNLDVDAVISEVEVTAISSEGSEPRNDLPPMQVMIHTAFGELDFLRLHAHGARRSKRMKTKAKQ